MAQKRFSWVNYDPPLWQGDDIDDFISAFETTAPDNENNRSSLFTKFYAVENSPHNSYRTYNVVHDSIRRYTAYSPDDPSSDNEVEITSIYAVRFTAYIPESEPGTFYAATGHDTLKEVFRRYRETTGREESSVYVRQLDLVCLQDALQDAEVVGYSFRNVSGQTPYRTLRAEGPQISTNTEAQDFVRRANETKSVNFELSSGSQLITLRIQADGSITFLNYPGDSIALGVIHEIEPFIEDCSGRSSARVFQRRGG